MNNIEAIHNALLIGLDAARQVASEYHQTHKGYREEEHKRVDEEVETIEKALVLINELNNYFEKQAADLKALRSTLNRIVDCSLFTDVEAYNLGLIDENGKPTPLLTGVKE